MMHPTTPARVGIYVTPIGGEPLECTAPSAPSGFATLDEVAAVLGDPLRNIGAALIYEGVMFSRFAWRIDAISNNA